MPRQYWGVCCSPPDYAVSDACQSARQKQPPADQGGQAPPLTPEEVKLLPAAWQKEWAQLKQQVQQHQTNAEQIQAQIAQMAGCETGCPGGAYAFTCTEENKDLCIAHNDCIHSCDATLPQLTTKINQLKKTQTALTKKATAFQKKVDAYKAKNKRKFRAIEGASH